MVSSVLPVSVIRVNRVPPTYLSTLQLVLTEQTEPLYREHFKQEFKPQDDAGILAELRVLIAAIDPPRPIIFRSNHASNAFALAGNLPKDQGLLLQQIDKATRHMEDLRPTWMRSL